MSIALIRIATRAVDFEFFFHYLSMGQESSTGELKFCRGPIVAHGPEAVA